MDMFTYVEGWDWIVNSVAGPVNAAGSAISQSVLESKKRFVSQEFEGPGISI